MEDIVQDLVVRMSEDINDKLEYYVRNLAVPPIKGRLTEGKLRWRGIRMIIMDGGRKRWIEQRGKKISPTIELVIKL
jgi:hypothetical protein